MAWGIGFVSLSAIQVPLPDLQELVILWSDKGNIRGYPALLKSLRRRRVKFQFLSVSAMVSQRAAPGGKLGLSEAHCTQQGNPLHVQRSSFPLCWAVPRCCPNLQTPPLLSQSLPMSCSPLSVPPTPDLPVCLGHYFILALFVIRFAVNPPFSPPTGWHLINCIFH